MKIILPNGKGLLASCLGVFLAMCSTGHSALVTYTWTGASGTNNNFSTTGNWSGGVVPTTTNNSNGSYDDRMIFGSVSVGSYTTVTLNQGDSGKTQGIGEIQFTSSAPAYTINSATGPYTMEIIGIGGYGLTNNSSNVQTFNIALKTKGTQTWTSGGGLNLDGGVIMNAAGDTLTFNGSGNVRMASLTNGTGSATTLVVNMASNSTTVTLNGNMSDISTVNVTQGTFLLGGDNLINDTNTTTKRTNMTLAGGVFNTAGYDADFYGTLTLTASSTIDMGSGSSILVFQEAASQSTLSGLTVLNWSGKDSGQGGNGTDQIIFGDKGSYTNGQAISGAYFYMPEYSNINGGYIQAGVLFRPDLGSTYWELVPLIPEPGTVVSGMLLLGALAGYELRRRKHLKAAQAA